MKVRICRALLCAASLSILVAGTAGAAPVTVNLRIEGPSSTLYEGTVTTDVKQFHFTGDATQHDCDGTAAIGGPSSTPVPTRGAALVTAIDAGLSATGTWFSFGPSFSDIGGQSVAFDPSTNKFLAEYENWGFANLGACADESANGDEALFAYGDGSETLLRLAGPATVAPGQAFAVSVYSGASSTGVVGATVGGQTTDGSGQATIAGLSTRGEHELKAEKPGAIRSNRLRVCVTDGADGFCGTSVPAPAAPTTVVQTQSAPVAAEDKAPPIATILGLRSGATYSKATAPRQLSGTIADQGPLKLVKLRILRKSGDSCAYFSGRSERFRKISCRQDGWWFGIGDAANWSYLLPSALAKGSHTVEVKAIDLAGNKGEVTTKRFVVR